MTREDAIKILQTRSCYECSYGCDSADSCENEGCYLREATLMAIEALKQPERKTGKWVEIDFQDGNMYGFHYCSECGIRTYCTFDTPPDWKYCPNCGSYNGGDIE